MQIKLFGCRIYLSLLFLSAVSLILLLDKTGLMLFGFAAVFIHEFGHLCAMQITGNRPISVNLRPAGILIERRQGIISQNSELLIAIAGIAVNIAVSLIFTSIYIIFHSENAVIFSAANLCVAAFNMLVINGLDGYDILRNLLCRKISEDTADTICKIISAVNIALLIFLLLYMFLCGLFSISLTTCTLYLVILALMNIRC